ncbi:MAG: pirin family protein [Cytophagales bacterium]
MKTIVHKSASRGGADHGWLKAKHSFSFANYYDPSKMQFGALRVLNDDLVAPKMGFGTHPHDNMEIISIVLNGTIRHKDSMGNEAEIKKDEVQIMSAGTGVKHSEFNSDLKETLNLLQIWIMPKEYNIKPRYDQVTLNPDDRKDKIQTIVAPNVEGAMWINQDAYLSRINLSRATTFDYALNKPENGVYIFVIEGSTTIGESKLTKRDAIGVLETNSIVIDAEADTELLFIEVPMK